MTYKHYNNPDNDRSNTFVLNILLIIDTFKEINPLVNETRHTNRILQVLNRAAKALNELSNPKIKLHISGVVKLKQINHSNLKVFKETQFAYYECYDIHLTYNAMSKWLFDDSATFGEIDYDMFVFAPNADLCIKNGGQLDSRSYYLPKNKDCTNTDDSSHPSGGLLDFDNENAELHIVQMIAENRFTCDEKNESDIGPVLDYDCNSLPALVKSSGGLIQYDPFFSLHVTQMIADRFHINQDNVLNCGSGHIMDNGKIDTCVTAINSRSWSNCSQSAFQSLPSTAEFLCYKMPAFKSDGEQDNDYQ